MIKLSELVKLHTRKL